LRKGKQTMLKLFHKPKPKDRSKDKIIYKRVANNSSSTGKYDACFWKNEISNLQEVCKVSFATTILVP